MNTPSKSGRPSRSVPHSYNFGTGTHANHFGIPPQYLQSQTVTKNITLAQERTRAQICSQLGISTRPPSSGYLSMGIGVFLIMLGFFAQSFMATNGGLMVIPYLVMGIGFILAIRHYVTNVV